MEWDLLRTFEAVARLGSFTAAAQALGLSQSTVSRHLGRLEEMAGSPLLWRESPVRLTDRGESLFSAVEPMVHAALEAQSALETQPALLGEVTLTTVGEMVRWVLVKHLPSFYRAYPNLRLRILVDNRTNSLAAGEADLALRLARPDRGELVARRVHAESFAFCVSTHIDVRIDVPWLGLTGSLGNIPEQRYAARVFSPRMPRLLVEDVESLGRAVEAGLGVALLPCRLVAMLHDVTTVAAKDIGALDVPLPTREVWLVVHQSKQRVPNIRAVIQWLNGMDWMSLSS